VVTDSDRKKRHGQKVSRCALILRVRDLFIKPHRSAPAFWAARDWFGRGKRVSFVPMRTIPPFPRLTWPVRWLACCLTACLAAACVAAPERGTGQATEEGEPAVAAQDGAPDTRTRVEPTDDEVMYRVFAAEYLGAEGDLAAAVGEYLEAAMLSDDPEIARRATRVAFAAEAWQQAAMAADRWAVLDAQNVAAHESAAAAMLNVNDYVGAEFHVMQILDLMNDSTEGWLLVSNLLAQSSDPVRADATLEQILARRKNASSADVFYARSQLAVQSRNLQQAFELARRAVESDPERIEFLTWAGRLALNLKLPETGLEYIRRAWQLEPDDHDLALAYADLLARTGDAESARKVMREMEQTPDVYLSRILFELAASERAAAEELFKVFDAMEYEDLVEKSFYQAQAAEALGYWQRAIDLYGMVEGGERALASALRRAELLAQQGNMQQARSELAELRLEPSELAVEESWLAEARILREAGDRDQAFRVLDQAVQEMPRSVPILYTRALLAAELGWVDIAEKDLRTVLASEPENAAALNALGYTLADQTERYDEAEALIRQAYILQPNEASIVDSMGWIAYKQGRYGEAEEFLRRAWKIDRNPEIAAHLGEVLWMSGRKEEAVKTWREAQEVDSQNPVLMETLERLGIVF
jgi:tetratricopeptide (TPR) repeat protein